MDDQIRAKIFKQVAGCMENLVGGSGHLASYHLDDTTFEITSVRDLGDGLTEYGFCAQAALETEFSEAVEEIDPAGLARPEVCANAQESEDPLMLAPEAFDLTAPERTEVKATIVLDADLDLALDDQGRVRLGGYTCLSPTIWHPDHQ